ncbi:hypothetical protein SNL152K_4668 [Streptomyces sp. NL15-2K]|nr:hypothetical protein SNL152K_4668 [Streptomyces sp. NL15-2K]
MVSFRSVGLRTRMIVASGWVGVDDLAGNRREAEVRAGPRTLTQ